MWESSWFLTGWRWKLRVYTTCDRNLKPELSQNQNMYNTAKKNSVSLCFFLRLYGTWKVGAVMKGTKPHSNNLRFTRNASHTPAICLKWPQMGKITASREAKYDLFSFEVQIFNIHKPRERSCFKCKVSCKLKQKQLRDSPQSPDGLSPSRSRSVSPSYPRIHLASPRRPTTLQVGSHSETASTPSLARCFLKNTHSSQCINTA